MWPRCASAAGWIANAPCFAGMLSFLMQRTVTALTMMSSRSRPPMIREYLSVDDMVDSSLEMPLEDDVDVAPEVDVVEVPDKDAESPLLESSMF